MDSDCARAHGRTTPQALLRAVEHLAGDGGHAREHKDVVYLKARGQSQLVVENLRPVGDARHAHARLIGLLALALEPGLEHRVHLGVIVDADSEGVRHAVRGDVVVGGSDAAGGEDVVVARAQCIERGGDVLGVVRHHPCLLQPDPHLAEPLAQEGEVLVLGAPGEDLVADDERGGGNGSRHDGSRLGRMRVYARPAPAPIPAR